jgi:hypothetical protein
MVMIIIIMITRLCIREAIFRNDLLGCHGADCTSAHVPGLGRCHPGTAPTLKLLNVQSGWRFTER